MMGSRHRHVAAVAVRRRDRVLASRCETDSRRSASGSVQTAVANPRFVCANRAVVVRRPMRSLADATTLRLTQVLR